MPEWDLNKEINVYYTTQLNHAIQFTNTEELKYVYSNDKVTILHNNKQIFVGSYQILGVHNVTTKIWFWTWSLPFVNKQSYEKLTQIKNLSNTLKNKYADIDAKDYELLQFYATNNYFYCSIETVTYIVQLALYLTKAYWFIKKQRRYNGDVIVEYILLWQL